MYIIRDVFHLKFGRFKEVKALMAEAKSKNMLPQAQELRMLSDFTGDAYRFIMEASFNSLADYEKTLSGSMNQEEWQQWYEKVKPLVKSSYREILKVVQ